MLAWRGQPRKPLEGYIMHNALPEAPGALLGYRKDGRPFYVAAGGDDTVDPPATPPAPPPAPAPPAPPAAPEPPAPPAPAGDGEGDAAKTERTVAAIREEFKAERAKRQAAEARLGEIQTALEADKQERAKQMDAFAIAFGLKTGDEPPDPAKLAEELKAEKDRAQAELAARDTELRAKTVELAVLQAAQRHGADGLALLDSRTFLGSVAGLDPAADDFAEKLGEAIGKAVEQVPRYKLEPAAPPPPAPPTPPKSGGAGDFAGTPGGNRQWTTEDVERASPQEVVQAQEQGLLIDLGFGPKKPRR
jgi:hypothetical protein